MKRTTITSLVHTISSRSVLGGGFSEQAGSSYRADATAWAVMALRSAGARFDLIDSARSRLASEQFDDGRVCFALDQPQAYWPTALAILAWNGSSIHRLHQDMAIHFLLKTKGRSSVGWPWIMETFSWVEPTALSIMALNLSGYGAHERVHEAVRRLKDYQLPSGGWNIGSLIIFGRETYPQIDCTGLALTALKGYVRKEEIDRSLHYLKSEIALCRTPLSLGWALFGLDAWGERPPEVKRWLLDCLSRQNKYGAYGTTLLSLVLLAYEAKGGFLETIS